MDRFRYILVKLQDKMNVWRMEDESATSKALQGKKTYENICMLWKVKKVIVSIKEISYAVIFWDPQKIVHSDPFFS